MLPHKMLLYHTRDFLGECRAFFKSFTNVDIIHYLDGEHTAQFLPLARFKKRPKIIATYHQSPRLLKDFVRKDVIAKLDHVLLVSPPQVPFFEDILPKNRVSVILHGIDTRYYRPMPKNSPTFKCLTVGHWLRDYEILYKVAKELGDVEFHIVDSKQENQGLKNIILHKHISDEALRTLYQSCDALLMPLKDCTANNSLLEGMACGLPILTSDLPAARVYMTPSGAMFLAKPEEFRDAIVALKNNPAKRESMGIQARKRAEELSWQNISKQFESLYENLLLQP